MGITNNQYTWDTTFREAYAEFLDIFDEEYNEDRFFEEAYRALRRYRFYPFGEQLLTTVSDANGTVELPCNIYAIEYVAEHQNQVWSDGSRNTISKITRNADPGNQTLSEPGEYNPTYSPTPNDQEYSVSEGDYVDSSAELSKDRVEIYYPTGRYLDYNLDNSKKFLSIQHCNLEIDILYRGLLVDDEDGFPLLTQDGATAIAYYVAFLIKQREAFKNRGDMNVANYFKMEADKLFRLAKTPIHISQNEINDMLDQMTRWDRKRYNYSFKPMTNTTNKTGQPFLMNRTDNRF